MSAVPLNGKKQLSINAGQSFYDELSSNEAFFAARRFQGLKSPCWRATRGLIPERNCHATKIKHLIFSMLKSSRGARSKVSRDVSPTTRGVNEETARAGERDFRLEPPHAAMEEETAVLIYSEETTSTRAGACQETPRPIIHAVVGIRKLLPLIRGGGRTWRRALQRK